MKRIDIKILFDCSNMCLFCVQWDKRLKFWWLKLEKIKTDLDKWIKDGAQWVVFTWWEPTLHKDLISAVKYAKKIWYTNIQIQSNWRSFSDLEYCKNLIKAWVNEFWPSIHWFYPKTHDFLVQRPWAWKQVIQWLKNLHDLWQDVIVNIVITKQNYKELPKLATLLVWLWVKQYQFAFIHILWSADKNKLDIVPKKSDAISYIKAGLDIWKKNNIICMTEAIPYCFMKWYERAIAESEYMPETQIFDAEQIIDSYNKYRWERWKIKWKPCQKCKLNNRCEWPWREYPEIYWWDEFKPIK